MDDNSIPQFACDAMLGGLARWLRAAGYDASWHGGVADPELVRIARRHGRTVHRVVFRFALDVGMAPLTGTADAGHMREDLAAFEFRLGPDEVERIECLAVT